MVERAERRRAKPLERRALARRRAGRRRPAPRRHRKPQQPLAVRPLAHARRIGHRVADPPVDRRHAGGRHVVEPGDRRARGPPREDRQPVVPGVAGEVDEDVEVVPRDERRDARVVEPGHLAPLDACLEGRIAPRSLRIVEIGMDAEAPGIVRREHAPDERGQRDVRVGRQVAKPERAVGDVDAGTHRGARRHVALDRARPLAMHRENRLGRAVGDELLGREPVRCRGGERRIGLERAFVRRDRVADAPRLLQQVAEIVVRGGAGRVEGQGAPERLDRAVGIARALAGVAEVDPRRGRARVERDRGFERAHRFARAPGAVQRRAEVHAVGRVPRRERHRPRERVDRFLPAARCVREDADPVPRGVQPGIARERLAIASLGLRPSGAVECARLVEDLGGRHRAHAIVIAAARPRRDLANPT
ncbi:hypothetical protein BURK1_01074 [Burkholderiales bacterium]|nr:hypothetical protein BURK1_01074 [Burkholderiales bacterium]